MIVIAMVMIEIIVSIVSFVADDGSDGLNDG